VSTAVKALRSDARVLGVEPSLAADTLESLARGQRVVWPAEMVGRTMADGLRGEAPAPLPFAHLRESLDGVLTVEEAQIAAAVRRAAADLKLVLEPSGAVTLAAFDALDPRPEGVIVVIASGGNVDHERYAEILRG
jgi:threonine dehydratase